MILCCWTASVEPTFPPTWFWTYSCKVAPVAEDAPVLLRTEAPSELLLEHPINLHLHYITSHNNYTYSKLLKYSWMFLMCCPCLKFTTQTYIHSCTFRTKHGKNLTTQLQMKLNCYRDRNVYQTRWSSTANCWLVWLHRKSAFEHAVVFTFNALTSNSNC